MPVGDSGRDDQRDWGGNTSALGGYGSAGLLSRRRQMERTEGGSYLHSAHPGEPQSVVQGAVPHAGRVGGAANWGSAVAQGTAPTFTYPSDYQGVRPPEQGKWDSRGVKGVVDKAVGDLKQGRTAAAASAAVAVKAASTRLSSMPGITTNPSGGGYASQRPVATTLDDLVAESADATSEAKLEGVVTARGETVQTSRALDPFTLPGESSRPMLGKPGSSEGIVPKEGDMPDPVAALKAGVRSRLGTRAADRARRGYRGL